MPLKLELAEVPVLEPLSRTIKEVTDGLELFARVRAMDPAGRVSVTLVLVNTLKLAENEFTLTLGSSRMTSC